MDAHNTDSHAIQREQIDAIERLAWMIADDDDQRFVLVFDSLLNMVEGFVARGGEEGVEYARSTLRRTADPHIATGRLGLRSTAGPFGPQTDSIYIDPVFIANAKELIRARDRIVGGVPTDEFPDCVAVGSLTSWCCTGTLVGPNVVVTAAHCVAGDCASRVYVGDDVNEIGAGREFDVADALIHPDYRPPKPNQDVAVLILAEDIPGQPRAVAGRAQLEAASTVRLAGFGNTDVFSSGGYGRRRMVDVPLASADPKYGADTETEFVAGAPFLDRDSCNGDSGGPAYVDVDGVWHLAGATSRATSSSLRPCGDGGIYTRVGAFQEWLRSAPGAHWS